MKRITTKNRAVDLFGPGKDGFRSGVPGISSPTYLSADWANGIQESIVRVIERAGIEPGDDYDQLSEAVIVKQELNGAGGAGLVGHGPESVADSLNALQKSAGFAFNNAMQFDAYGDSITWGVAGTSQQSNGYAFLLSGARGWTINNNAVNGSMVGDQTSFVYAKAVVDGTQSTLMLGTNDFRVYKNDAAKKERYREGHQALLAWLAIPDDRKIMAQRPNATKLVYTGTWVASPYWGGGLGMRSSVVGSTVSAFVYGTTVYAGVSISEGDNTTFDVSVDGISYGTVSNVFAAGDLVTQNGRTYLPKLIRIDGLFEGEHEVKLTVLTAAAGNLFFDWAAGNLGNVTKDGPNLWVGNIPKLSNFGYSSLGGTDNSTVAAYNAIIRNNVAELAGDGLNVALVDSSSRVNNIIHLAPDGIHPNDAGHQVIAGVFLEAFNQAAKPRGYGALPPVSKFNSIQVGGKALQSSGSPKTISLGGTYSNTPGANLKLKLLEAAGVEYGIGVSANSIDYRGSATTVHSFYFGDAIKVVIADGVRVKEGANAMQGAVPLVAGEVTVLNNKITAISRIFVTSQVDGGAVGFLRVRQRVVGYGFTIASSSLTDTSTVAYEIFEPL